MRAVKLVAWLFIGLTLMASAGLAHLKEFAHSTARLHALLQEPASTIVLAIGLGWIPPLLCEVAAFALGLFTMVRAILQFGHISDHGTQPSNQALQPTAGREENYKGEIRN